MTAPREPGPALTAGAIQARLAPHAQRAILALLDVTSLRAGAAWLPTMAT